MFSFFYVTLFILYYLPSHKHKHTHTYTHTHTHIICSQLFDLYLLYILIRTLVFYFSLCMRNGGFCLTCDKSLQYSALLILTHSLSLSFSFIWWCILPYTTLTLLIRCRRSIVAKWKRAEFTIARVCWRTQESLDVYVGF